MTDETLRRVEMIVRDVLDNDDVALAPETVATDVEGWDSLAHVRIMIAIEKAFGIRFDTEELSEFSDVGTLVKGIDAKLG